MRSPASAQDWAFVVWKYPDRQAACRCRPPPNRIFPDDERPVLRRCGRSHRGAPGIHGGWLDSWMSSNCVRSLLPRPATVNSGCRSLSHKDFPARESGPSKPRSFTSALDVRPILNLYAVAVLLHQRVALGLAQILAHHFLDELLEARLRLPAQFLFRPRGIADEGVDFGGPEIARVHGDDFFSRGVERVLVGALALPPEADVEPRRRQVHEFAHAVLLARRDHQILGLGLLQHQPLRLDIVARVAPVAPRVEVAEVQAILHSEFDAGEAARDLARDEDLAADRRFVVEEDAVAGIEAVGLAVVDRDPVRVELRHAVGRARIEGSRFALR